MRVNGGGCQQTSKLVGDSSSISLKRGLFISSLACSKSQNLVDVCFARFLREITCHRWSFDKFNF